MAFARRLANAENPIQQDSAERVLNKLARTFTAQVENPQTPPNRRRAKGYCGACDGKRRRKGYRRPRSPRGDGFTWKVGTDLMNAAYPYQKSPRCSAISKRTRRSCLAPAVKGWTVCRFHGARGGGPKGERNGRHRHGFYTKLAGEERKMLRWILRQCSQSEAELRRR